MPCLPRWRSACARLVIWLPAAAALRCLESWSALLTPCVDDDQKLTEAINYYGHWRPQRKNGAFKKHLRRPFAGVGCSARPPCHEEGVGSDAHSQRLPLRAVFLWSEHARYADVLGVRVGQTATQVLLRTTREPRSNRRQENAGATGDPAPGM